ncbi:MAG: AI-2E family transporter [Flavobacteriaceae bacterium]|nr:AI-2E family transporter [Flavobacteriaceae bacterium]
MKTQDSSQAIDVYIKIVVLSVLIVASYLIAKPFLLLIIWAILVAVTLFPFYEKVLNLFKGKKKGLVTTLFVVALLAIIVTPTVNIASSVVDSSKEIISSFNAGTIEVSPPNQSVKSWPLIGEKIFTAWNNASIDIQGFIQKHPDEVKSSAGWFFDSFTGLIGSVFLSLIALIIAGIFMSSAKGGYKTGLAFAEKMMTGKGEEIMSMCINTIRSVVKGILLVAIIQAILAFIGFQMIGLSMAGILAIIVMIGAIIQIPVTLIVIPIIIFVFSFADTTPAIIFTIYIIIVSLLDNFLKPMLLAKGLETPMIVILIGAIGGMMFLGILGLFIGPVILAISHRLYTNWVNPDATI